MVSLRSLSFDKLHQDGDARIADSHSFGQLFVRGDRAQVAFLIKPAEAELNM
jgi:hypothetical protein